jgi:hypothetical protein
MNWVPKSLSMLCGWHEEVVATPGGVWRRACMPGAVAGEVACRPRLQLGWLSRVAEHREGKQGTYPL